MANLLERAADGIRRADWKLAIDSLQRILESEEGSLFYVRESEPDGGPSFAAAQMFALRLLSQLPPEGLTAYRILYDGQAEHLLRRGLDTNDIESLRAVVNRFLLTHSGDDAADALSSRLLDAGRAVEAVGVIDLALWHVPDSDVSRVRMLAKRAAGLVLMGRQKDVRSTIDEIRRHGESTTEEIVQSVSRLMSELEGERTARDAVHGTQGITPALVEPLPWHYQFSELNEGLRESYEVDADAPLFLPWQAVVDGDRLFVRFARGVAALRADDLTEIWSTTGNLDPLALSGPLSWESISRDLHSWVRPPDDALFGFLSASHGLVFAIDRKGDLSSTDSFKLFKARRFNWGPGIDAARGFYLPNRLVAYDATRGVPVWARGMETDSAYSRVNGDQRSLPVALGDVEFRALPLAVGDELWVSYFRQRDFYVGVLDPATGSLRREIPLCSVDARSFATRPAQPLAHGYGMVYVPSGHGVLFAIDAQSKVVRWAGEYGEQGPSESSESSSGEGWWEPAPPLVKSGLAILCPSDHHEVVAFSALSGRERWTIDAGGVWYPIAVDDRHVWLGGSSVVCVQLDDGEQIWSTRLPAPPTGRGLRSGDRLLLPSLQGLVTLHVYTGAQDSLSAVSMTERPLRNLVAIDDAVYSVDSMGVRRFPDLERSYANAAAQFDADPASERAARQLAWAEFHQGHVSRALEVLDMQLKTAGCDISALQDDSIAVWVESLLAHAARMEDPEASMDEYRRAVALARAPHDRIRCRLALAEHLIRLEKYAAAYRELWDAGLSADADVSVSLGGANRGPARLQVRARLLQLAEYLNVAELGAIRQHVELKLDDAIEQIALADGRRAGVSRLAAISELASWDGIGQRAQYELGIHRLSQQKIESGEQWLLASSRGPDRQIGAASLMSLCDHYDQSPFNMTHMQGRRLAELKRRFADDAVPVPIGSDSKIDSGAAAEECDSVSAWVDAKTRALGAQAMNEDGAGTLAEAFTLSGDIMWALPTPEKPIYGRLVEFDSDDGVPVAERLVFVDEFGSAIAYDAKGESMQWRTDLRLSGRFDEPIVDTELDADVSRRALVSGQVGVFAGHDAFFGVGLMSGKRLWAKAHDGGRDAYSPWHTDMRMAVGDGVAVLVTRRDRAELVRLADGATIWAHEMHGEGLAFAWIVGDVALTSDERLERVHILDLEDGRIRKKVLFRQPDPDDTVIRPAHTAGVLCGPVSTTASDALQAVDVHTGEPLWELELPKPLIQLFVPQEGYIGIGMLRGAVHIVDARSGEVILRKDVPAVRGVEDGVLLDGLLIVQYANPVMGGRRRQPGLIAVDIATGEMAWHRNDLAPVAGFNAKIHLYGHVIPAIVVDEGENRAKYRSKSLVTINARTGRNIGGSLKLVGENSRTQVLNDFRVFSDRVLVATDKQYLTLGITPVESERVAEE